MLSVALNKTVTSFLVIPIVIYLFVPLFVCLFVCLMVCLFEQNVGVIQLSVFRNHMYQAIVYVRRNIFVEYIVKIKLVNVPRKMLLNRLPFHTRYFSFQPVLHDWCKKKVVVCAILPVGLCI